MSATELAEEIVRFGSEDALLGVVTVASRHGAERDNARPAVLISNAGVIHRVGPHRMNVVLARQFAKAGFAAMRYDVGGLGDSKATRGDLSFRDRSVADTRAAMDLIQRTRGIDRFVLFGLCSGADNGLATALVDPRVTGLMMVDPYTYVTARAQARKLETKLRTLGSARRIAEWGLSVGARVVKNKLEQVQRAKESEQQQETQEGREAPPKEVFGDWLKQLLDRRVSILALYSGALRERYNHEDQLFEVFPELRGRVDREWFPEANHTFTPRAAQSRLVNVATDWLTRRFPS